MKDKAEEFLRDKFCGDPILTETILRSHYGNGQTLAELMAEFHDQQSKWISVDERLPEVHGSVLIFKPSDFPDKVYVGWLSEGNRWFEEDGPDGVSFVDEVTHWMPLPDPPA